jgi:hypothetical protein
MLEDIINQLDGRNSEECLCSFFDDYIWSDHSLHAFGHVLMDPESTFFPKRPETDEKECCTYFRNGEIREKPAHFEEFDGLGYIDKGDSENDEHKCSENEPLHIVPGFLLQVFKEFVSNNAFECF